jgi:hypothetical protein
MTNVNETTNVDTSAADAVLGTAKKREVSPQATAALAAYRARAELGLAILEVLEAGDAAVLAKYTKQAEVLVAKQAAEKAAAKAAAAANAGAGLEGYRAKTKEALVLAEYLKSTGVNVDELLAKAAAAQTAPQGE